MSSTPPKAAVSNSGGRVAGLTGIYFIGNLVQRLVPLTLIPILTRTLSPTEFGLYSLCVAIIAVLSTLCSLGLDAAAIRFYHDNRGTASLSAYLFNSFVFCLIGTVTVALLLGAALAAAWQPVFRTGVNAMPFVPLIAGAAGLDTIINFQQALARARQRAISFLTMRLMQLVLQGLFAIGLVLVFDGGATNVLQGYLAGSAVVAIWTSWRFFGEFSPAAIESAYARQNLSYGLPTVPQKLSNWVNNLSDRLILTRFTGFDQLAVYQLGYSTGQIISFVIASINSAYVPTYYQMKHAGKGDALFVAIDCTIVAVLGLLAVGGALFAPEIVAILGPVEYRDAIQIAPVIIAAYYLNGVYTQFLKELFFAKRTGLASLVVSLPAMLTIPANFYLIPRFGYTSAAYVTLAAFAIVLVTTVIVGQLLVEHTGHPQVRLAINHIVVVSLCIVVARGHVGSPTPLFEWGHGSAALLANRLMIMLGIAIFSALLLILPHRKQLLHWFKS